MRILPYLPLLTLAACVAPPPPAPPPPPPRARAPAPPPPPPVALSWEIAPTVPGGWTWQRDGRGSVAMFGVAGQDAGFVVRCDLAERRISLTMPGTISAGAQLTILTTDGARALPATATGATPPYAGAALRADDPFLDRLAFSRGRIRIQLGSAPPQVLPAWPEIARTIEDCRG